MARRYHRRHYEDNELERFVVGVSALVVFGLVSLYFTNRPAFWRWVAYIFLIFIGLIGIAFLWREAKSRLSRGHLNNILDNLKKAGQEEYLENFINRFGLESGRGKGWSYRNHNFEWDRINDLRKILKETGVTANEKDVFALLRFFIQEKEEQLTRESIRRKPQVFAHLSGTEFEKLLYRLFAAAGYKVELIGHSGDQGGDLIANKVGERVLIQAKCYRDWSTGNAAVQQVVGAMKHYDCNKAMVVTTSHFTNEAIILAKDNNVELVSKEQLQGLLLKFVGESWS